MAGSIHIGTSGWSYKHWKDIYYPPKLKNTEWLTYYSRQFDVAEINTSFYHLPKKESVVGWMEKTPPYFLFCPKLSRYITHMKKLNGVEEALERFFGVFNSMHAQLGPVLIQLPPQLGWEAQRAVAFYELLKKWYSAYTFVLEVRHSTWLQPTSLEQLRLYGIGLVIAQSNGIFPYSEEVTAPAVYLRFHGPDALYASGYTEEQLQYYASKCRQWADEGHEVWAFFNNDIHGFAFKDAHRLKELVSK